jgi:hypothetical protein
MIRQVQCFRIFTLLDPDSESGSNPDPKHWSSRYGMVGKYYHFSFTYVNIHFFMSNKNKPHKKNIISK